MDTDQNAEVVGERGAKWQPWLHPFLWWPGAIGCVVVLGVAVIYSEDINHVPYYKTLIALLGSAIVMNWLEKLWHKLRSPAAACYIR